jgi:hypothetical protein
VFPVRYELFIYILFIINLIFKNSLCSEGSYSRQTVKCGASVPRYSEPCMTMLASASRNLSLGLLRV